MDHIHVPDVFQWKKKHFRLWILTKVAQLFVINQGGGYYYNSRLYCDSTALRPFDDLRYDFDDLWKQSNGRRIEIEIEIVVVTIASSSQKPIMHSVYEVVGHNFICE